MNKAGESWPSYETKPHLARHKNLAPTIDKGAGGSKSVKVGSDIQVVMTPFRVTSCQITFTCFHLALPYFDLLLFLYYETISYTGCIV